MDDHANNFGYDKTGFYVKSIDGQPYTRAPCDTLYANLKWAPDRPFLTKKGLPVKRKHKDPTLYYYYAQLLHYGLKPVKTKPAAKKLLLNSIEAKANKTLVVPQALQELEKGLKASWDEEQEKVQRKREERAEEMKQRIKLAQEQEALEPSNVDALCLSSLYCDTFTGYMGKTITERDMVSAVSSGELSEKHLRNIILKILRDPDSDSCYALKHTVAEEMKNQAKEERSSQRSTQAKNSGKPIVKSDYEGLFNITCPGLVESYSQHDEDFTLQLHTSLGGSRLWGKFNLGIFAGFLRCTYPPPTTIGSTVNFFWRGREQGEGELNFGFEGSNNGYIVFLGKGKLFGYIDTTLGNWEFEGSLAPRQPQLNKPDNVVKKWKREWRGMTEEAHERERVSRWGTRCGEPKREDPHASDTTDGHRSESDCEEDDFWSEGSGGYETFSMAF